MAVSERKILPRLWNLAVGFLGIMARFAVAFPLCLCAFDFLTATWFCIVHMNFADNGLEMLGCPLVGLFFMVGWMHFEPNIDFGESKLLHFLFMSLVALAIAIAWAIIDRRRSGKRRRLKNAGRGTPADDH